MRLSSVTTSPRLFPTLMGAFGVAMGFAAFVLLREKTQVHRASAAPFLLGLLAASITSFAIESVRERAEGEGKHSVADPGRVLGLLVLLAIFEVYVSGSEEVVQLVADGGGLTFIGELFASGISASVSVAWQLLLFAGLWVALGAAAAWSMLHEGEGVGRRAVLLVAVRRVGRGLAMVAGMTFAYVVVARLVLTLWVLLTRPQDYAPGFSSLLPEPGQTSGNAFAQLPILLASGLEALAHQGRWGGVALLVATVGVVVVLDRSTRNPNAGMATRLVAWTMLGTLLLLVLGPFLTSATQGGRLLRIVGATTLTWLAPLVVLAVAMPQLRGNARSPKVWGIVAFVVAVVLVAVTWDRLSEPPVPLFVATLVVALLVTGWLFRRGADLVKFWPLVALTLAIAVFEGSSVLRRLTFLTTFKEAALLQSAPVNGAVEAKAARGFRVVAAWGRAGDVDPATAALVHSVDDVPSDAAREVLDSMAAATTRSLDAAFAAALGPLCTPSGSAPLDTLHRDVLAACARVRQLAPMSPDAGAGVTHQVQELREPWGAGFTALLDGADEQVAREAFDFRWRDPGSPESRAVAERASAHLPARVIDADPGVIIAQAMRDSTLDPSVRMWMVLAAFARSSPAGTAVQGWMRESERQMMATARDEGGVPLFMALGWWYRHARRVRELVEGRFTGGVPEDAAAAGSISIPRRPDPFQRALRTVVALRFANEQVQERKRTHAEGAVLEADAGASMALELSLGASFAFWATAGLLAGLSGRKPDPH